MGESIHPRPPPTASGTLAKTPFLHLLLYAHEKRLTGSIELFSPDQRSAAVVFVNGEPGKVRTSEPVAYLGRVLKDLGHLTEEQLTSSLADLAKAKAQGPMLHGELLVARGLVDSVARSNALHEQLARKLRHVGEMPGETAYAYYEGFDSLQRWGGEAEPVDPLPLLWAMLVESAPWGHVTAALGRISSSPLRLVPTHRVPRLGLGPAEVSAARLLSARPMNAADFARAGGLDERNARLLTYLLLVTKQVDVLAPAETPQVRRPSEPKEPVVAHTSAPPLAAMPKGTSSGRYLSSLPAPPAGLSPELAERWREIVDRASTIDRADYFMMLDIARDASRDDVESAFFALVKRWHPDRLPQELAPVRDACSRVFARMSEAQATLVDDENRARYMRLIADGSGSPEMQATVAKVVDAATNFQKAEVCFRRNDLGQAETFCRKALEDDSTQADYRAMLAWLVALKRENQTPEKTVESIRMLEGAIAMNEKCEKAYFWRGMLFQRLGKNELAVSDFKRAVELNPRNIDAAREVRLHYMRGGRRSSKPPREQRHSTPAAPLKAGDSAKPGILERLFKKS